MIKLDDELVIKIRKNGRFRKIIKDELTESKITRFALVFAEKSNSEVERNFQKLNREFTEIKDEIKLTN